MKNTTVNIVSSQKAISTFDIDNQSMSVQAVPNVDFVILDKDTKLSPKQLRTTKKGNDLVIKKEDDDETYLVIKDYFTTENVEVLGVQDGQFSSYGLNSSQASIDSITTAELSSTALSGNDYSPLLLGLLGAGVVGIAAASNDSDRPTNSNSTTPTPTSPTITPTPTPTKATVTTVEAVKSVDEGKSLVATVKLDNTNGNDKVAFALSGVASSDYGNATFSNGVTKNADGTLNVPKGVKEFSVTLPIVADKATEGDETLTLKVGDKSVAVGIADASTTPTPTPTPTPTKATVTTVEAVKSVDEGKSLVATVKLDNTNGNDKVAFSISGVEKADYGNVVFGNGVKQNADGTLNVPKGVKEFSVALPIVADKATEGNQNLVLGVGSKNATVQVVDTSTTPAPTPTITKATVTSISAEKPSVNEGERITLTVRLDNPNGNPALTTNIGSNKDYNVTFNGVTVNKDGTLNIPKGVDRFTITLDVIADNKTEGDVSATLSVGDKQTMLNINDTSVTPAPIPPTPTITKATVTTVEAVKSVDEGKSLVATVKLDNTNGNDKVAFSISGVEKADYGNVVFGNGVKQNADGTLNVPKGVKEFSVTLPIVADKATEGDETLAIKVGDKTQNVTIIDVSVAVVQGINVDTRIIDNKWDLQGGPTEKEMTSRDHTDYYTDSSGAEHYTKHHADGIKTTNADDTIKVGYVGNAASRGNVFGDLDLADGNDHLELKGGQVLGTSVHFGEGNDTYIINGHLGNQRPGRVIDDIKHYAGVFMEKGDDKIIAKNFIGNARIYLGNGNDTAELRDLEESLLDLGSGIYKRSYQVSGNQIEIDDYKKFYSDGKTSLNTDIADEKGMVNTATIGRVAGSEIYGGDAIDRLTIHSDDGEKRGKQNIIDLGGGDNEITINSGVRSTITTADGNDILNINDSGRRSSAKINLGDGNNSIAISKNDFSGSIITGKGRDTITLDADSELVKADVQTGSGHDILTINKDYEKDGTFVFDSSVHLGNGNNEIVVKGRMENSKITALEGNDSFIYESKLSDSNDLNIIDLGDGDNSIKAIGGGGNKYVTGSGSDNINITTSAALDPYKTSIHAGGGMNNITVNVGPEGSSYKNIQIDVTALDGDDTLDVNGNLLVGSMIDLGHGNNDITISGEVRGSQFSTGFTNWISTGDGNDNINIYGHTEGVNINTGGGTNNINIYKGVTGSITTLDGKDTIIIKGTSNSGLIKMGNGENYLDIEGHNTSNISLGNHNDTVVIKGNNHGNIITENISDSTNSADVIKIGGKNLGDIILGNGKNTLTIAGESRNSVITTGHSNDEINLMEAFSMKVNAGNGNNVITLNKDAFATNIEAGNGDDKVVINGNFNASTTGVNYIKLGGGTNYLHIKGKVDGASLFAEEGNDTIIIEGDYRAGYADGVATLNLGDGVNHLTINGSITNFHSSNSKIISGINNDIITIKGENSMSIETGDGDDIVSLGSINSGRQSINGGNGFDSLKVNNAGSISLSDLLDFESIDMTSADGKAINTLTINSADSYQSYMNTLDNVGGLYVRGDDGDKIKLGQQGEFTKTNQTINDKNGEAYDVWQATNNNELQIYIQSDLVIL
ncbi:Uncharacterised protein [Moraxella lacunata]|uniref:Cyclolysin n=1 Tax=Moraxella lacunata TaxID=477 RepID=A0A378T5P0_MORLA|nr:hypothetical protein [Moraxella lacunata]STZ55714.1 Uncharacterised protein [Moraxella lacunata]